MANQLRRQGGSLTAQSLQVGGGRRNGLRLSVYHEETRASVPPRYAWETVQQKVRVHAQPIHIDYGKGGATKPSEYHWSGKKK